MVGDCAWASRFAFAFAVSFVVFDKSREAGKAGQGRAASPPTRRGEGGRVSASFASHRIASHRN